jgi:hypothetical protein
MNSWTTSLPFDFSLSIAGLVALVLVAALAVPAFDVALAAVGPK